MTKRKSQDYHNSDTRAARENKKRQEAAIKGKMREVMGEEERKQEGEGGILEVLPRIGKISPGGAAEGFDSKS